MRKIKLAVAAAAVAAGLLASPLAAGTANWAGLIHRFITTPAA